VPLNHPTPGSAYLVESRQHNNPPMMSSLSIPYLPLASTYGT